jgi:hypothetical protein
MMPYISGINKAIEKENPVEVYNAIRDGTRVIYRNKITGIDGVVFNLKNAADIADRNIVVWDDSTAKQFIDSYWYKGYLDGLNSMEFLVQTNAPSDIASQAWGVFKDMLGGFANGFTGNLGEAAVDTFFKVLEKDTTLIDALSKNAELKDEIDIVYSEDGYLANNSYLDLQKTNRVVYDQTGTPIKVPLLSENGKKLVKTSIDDAKKIYQAQQPSALSRIVDWFKGLFGG